MDVDPLASDGAVTGLYVSIGFKVDLVVDALYISIKYVFFRSH